MKETKASKTTKSKTTKNTKKVSEEVVAVTPDPVVSDVQSQSVSTPANLGKRLMPPNLIAELDSILERLTRLENLLLK